MPEPAMAVALTDTALQRIETTERVVAQSVSPLARRRRVLIVSPHFPPVSAPDMQRVRMSLPYYREYGWDASVLAVAPGIDEVVDPLLNDTLDPTVPVERVHALSPSLTRLAGVGNVALRALPFLYTAGRRLIRQRQIDLVYFSTTMFLSMPLARLWRARFGTPYVLDFQDPWLTDYYETHPESAPPPKYAIARHVHAALEPWTMAQVGGIVAVSDGYVETLRKRYPWIDANACATIPFAASALDFDVIAAKPQPNQAFRPNGRDVHGVYVGRGGDDMRQAAQILFAAFAKGLSEAPDRFESVKLHFVGTDYATDDRARRTIEPVAASAGVAGRVSERTARVPYFEALQLLRDADFLVLIGSDDEQYTASKIYPYLMAGKPILAIVHEHSGLVPLLQRVSSCVLVTFPAADESARIRMLADAWRRMLESGCRAAPLDADVAHSCSAREMTRRQCALFDQVFEHHGGAR